MTNMDRFQPPNETAKDNSGSKIDEYPDDVDKTITKSLPQPPPNVTLTDEQFDAICKISAWLGTGLYANEFKLGGYAGTGKTTVIKSLIKELSKQGIENSKASLRITVTAFTGKACNVLQRKGVPSQTLHSLMYNCLEDPKTRQMVFEKRPTLAGDPDFIIVDEASMISNELYDDLKSFDKSVLFVGDPGQLEPVGSNPNLMHAPDIVLSKIHRQAQQSPIITFANEVRIGASLGFNRKVGEELTVRSKQLTNEDLLTADQVICAKNKTRVGLNHQIRGHLSRPAKSISVGEKIIVLRNNLSFGVFNGMILFVDEIHQSYADYWDVTAKDEVGKYYSGLKLWKIPLTDPFFEAKEDRIPRDRVYFDYGYAITCHKSQGSEWDHVLVFDEWMPPNIWDMKRWRYTAITRASKKLTYCK